ncbi:MAG: cytochrome C [Planctomycetota bacterium]
MEPTDDLEAAAQLAGDGEPNSGEERETSKSEIVSKENAAFETSPHANTPYRLVDYYPQAAQSGCMACHGDIEPIREPGSEMLQQIMDRGAEMGDPAGCIVCHNGDATERKDKMIAHGGDDFYADPGSPWVNEETCGQCHQEQVRVQWQSLMMTEAGKIQGTCWSFGALTGYEHKYANYAVENPSDPEARLGTPQYRAYMQALREKEPQVFVDKHEPLPEGLGVDELDKLNDDPTLAAFTYIRQECNRCHHAVKGRSRRGDFRGMGCSSCHVPYSNEGRYEGHDTAINPDETARPLTHQIQGTRQATVTVNGISYHGLPAETCTTCHNRGKRIGVSFQGLMETPYASPFTAEGKDQPGLHTKHYIAMEQDIHYQKGMKCQDCHTSIDVHGDGFLAPTNLASVQIECSDCHGTPDAYPWDLPIGYMDEFEMSPATGKARGTTDQQLPHTWAGTAYDPKDGFLLTARGNPYENVVRDGDEVIVHTAAGKDLRLKPLKKLFQENIVSTRAKVSMRGVGKHLERMECYTCHASWTPQCFGCHVKIDYSQKDRCPECNESKSAMDWIAAGRRHMEKEHRADRGESQYNDLMIPGKVSEQRSYLRWEEPMMGVNGEGRVTPLAPGCQPSITIIGPDGQPILTNHIFKTPEGLENSESGQLAIDMSPTQPHTMTKNARTCESCHANDKALGLGIGGPRPWNKKHFVDLQNTDGTLLTRNAQPQMEAIENLDHDWSQIVDADGNQVATVGHHWKLSRAFNKEEIQHMKREGTCIACHKELPTESLATSFLHHVARYTGQIPKTNDEHQSLVHKITLLAAWVQLLGVGVLLTAGGGGLFWLRRRWRKRQ